MRHANRIVAEILEVLGQQVAPGRSTMEFEEIVQAMCREREVRPAFQGYHGFPFALCCSVNEEIVHGFPSERVLKEGDIVSFDVGVVHQGFYGDSARTYCVGSVSEDAKRLVETTREALAAGISQALPGNDLYALSAAIQHHAESAGYGVVQRFVGHGIGRSLHEKPEVPNFVPRSIPRLPLKAGMTLAIEPMVTMGEAEVEILSDRWTAVTKDRSLSAHFEDTIVVTKDGPEILSSL